MPGPNIAMVVMDTARATETVPADPSVTPTLAELADEGVAYERAFTSAPWTLPSHASLFTGAYSSRHGAHGDHTYLDDDLTTLAEVLSTAGYETVGVSSNTWLTEEFGFARGFESFYRTWQFIQSGTDLGELTRIKHGSGKVEAFLSRLLDGNPLVNGVNAFYDQFVRGTDDDGAKRTTGMFADWLDEREDDRPFFCFANYIEPHVEYSPPREVAERFLPEGSYEAAREIRQQPRAYDVGEYDLTENEFSLLRGLYRGELAYLDSRIAALREALREADEWEDTVLVVCGDHGENIGDHGFFGHQYNVYDTLLHVPLIVHGPGFDPAVEEDELVQLLDLFPTLLDVAGVDAPAAREQSQGRSLLEHREPRDAVFAEYVAPQPSMKQLEERFGEVPEDVYEYDRSLRAIRTDEYKYVRGSDGLRELYDVRRDPQETVDLAGSEPGLVREFDDRIDAWLDSYDHAEGGDSVEMADATEDRLRDLGYL